MKQLRFFITGNFIFIGALSLIGLVYVFVHPSVRPVAVLRGEEVEHVTSWGDLPTDTSGNVQTVIIAAESPLLFGFLEFSVDDCLETLIVNGHSVSNAALPYCDWSKSLILDLREYVHAGTNTLTATYKNTSGNGGLRVSSSSRSWFHAFTFSLLSMVIVAYARTFFRKMKRPEQRVLVVLIVIGVLLRLYYGFLTDYQTRAYDWDGHVEYIRYIADHWVLPKGNEGWEFHQQPLYYLVGAVIFSITRFLHQEDEFVSMMQLLSIVMSIGIVFTCAWISKLLFPDKTQHVVLQRTIFLGSIVSLPAIVMLTSRINNDVPALFFSVLCIGFVLEWLKKESLQRWFFVCMLLTMALLSKSSTLPLLGFVGLAMLLRGDPWRIRMRNAFLLVVVVGLFVGGIICLRVVVQQQRELVPVHVSEGLRVKNFPAAYYVFNPLEIVAHPFNNNWVDTDRRQYLWEYFFKSIFFGEWGFHSFFLWQAITTLVAAMALIPVVAWGFVRSIARLKVVDILLGCLMLSSLAALASFRFMHPNSSNQEIRYVSFVLIAVLYFLAKGIVYLPYRSVVMVPWCVLVACSFYFLVLIPMVWR